jgi:uncharacterized OB-fold protein
MTGAVYTETTVFSPPEAYVNDAPYQLIIVTLDEGGRLTGRVLGDAVRIGDRVVLAEARDGVPYFKKA